MISQRLGPLKGFLILAAALSFEPDDRVMFTKCTIFYSPKDGNRTPSILRGERIYLKLDGPVRSVSELISRHVVSMELSGGFETINRP